MKEDQVMKSQYLVRLAGAKKYLTVLHEARDLEEFYRYLRDYVTANGGIPLVFVEIFGGSHVLINPRQIEMVSGPNDPKPMEDQYRL